MPMLVVRCPEICNAINMAFSLKILVLFDAPFDVKNHKDDLRALLSEPDWQEEQRIIQTLQKMGHDVQPFCIFQDIAELVSLLHTSPPEVVFFCCETFANERNLSPHIISLLELMKIKHTSPSSSWLQLFSDKAHSKVIFKSHNFLTPDFIVQTNEKPPTTPGLRKFPVIIKPRFGDASEGISMKSLALTAKDCHRKIRQLRKTRHDDLIVEEYIEGREIYLSLLGGRNPLILPARELLFNNNSNSPLIAGEREKFDLAYRRKMGIRTVPLRDRQLSVELQNIGQRFLDAFDFKGPVRLDLRVTAEHQIYILEANPNPALGSSEDFVLSSKKSGFHYRDILTEILSAADVCLLNKAS
jgi:D-alanine-D-alanine ligase